LEIWFVSSRCWRNYQYSQRLSNSIKSQSARHPYISVGFASTPISLNDQIKRTPEHTPPEYFAIERAWTSEINADITIILNNFKNEKGVKTREIVLVVASGRFKRLHPAAAQSLFQAISEALNDKLNLKEWNRPDGKKLLARRAVWTHHTKGAGRKFIRPLVEVRFLSSLKSLNID
jgi:exopolyphosphatase